MASNSLTLSVTVEVIVFSTVLVLSMTSVLTHTLVYVTASVTCTNEIVSDRRLASTA